MIAHVVDLDDIRMPQARDRLRFTPKPREFVRSRVRAGKQHLQGDEAVERRCRAL